MEIPVLVIFARVLFLPFSTDVSCEFRLKSAEKVLKTFMQNTKTRFNYERTLAKKFFLALRNPKDTFFVHTGGKKSKIRSKY